MSTTRGEYIANLTRDVVKTTCFDFHTLTGSSVQGCAEFSVAGDVDLGPEKCTMHQYDIIGKSAI